MSGPSNALSPSPLPLPLTFIRDHGDISVVPAGSIIYRGQTDAFDIKGDTAILARNVISPSRHTYFGVDYETIAENYGITTALTVKEDLNLMNIHKVPVFLQLKEQMTRLNDKEALKALNKAYPLVKGKVMRESDKNDDLTVLNFICTHTKYDGYFQPAMPTPDGGTMHSEIAVCKQHGFKVHQAIGSKALPMPGGRTFTGVKDESLMRKHKQADERRRAEARKRPAPAASPVAARRRLAASPVAVRRAPAAAPVTPVTPVTPIRNIRFMGSPPPSPSPSSPVTPPPRFKW